MTRIGDSEALRKRLSPLQFAVTMEAATERPFTGEFWDHHEDGIYRCIVCGAELFDSTTKYDSRCGWPSFFDADQSKLTISEDRSHGMVRTEVRCASCGAHMGHLFPDGPRPTGLRYCINSASLDFDARNDAG